MAAWRTHTEPPPCSRVLATTITPTTNRPSHPDTAVESCKHAQRSLCVPGLKHVVCRHATYASEALSVVHKKKASAVVYCGYANVREFENTAKLSATVQPAGISATKTSMQGNGGPKRLLRRRSSPPTAAAVLCVRPIIMKKKAAPFVGCCWAPKAGLYRREAAKSQEPWIIPRPHTHPPSHTQAAR